MQIFWPVVGILTVAAITLGPNNAIVMAHAASDGLSRAILSILVIAASSVVLAVIAFAAVDLLFAPPASDWLAIAGAAALLVMAIGLWRAAGKPHGATEHRARDLLGLMVFQLVNAKGWIMMAIVAAQLPPNLSEAMPTLAAIPLVTGACLTVWAAGGAFLQRFIASARARANFDRAIAALLGCFALMLLA